MLKRGVIVFIFLLGLFDTAYSNQKQIDSIAWKNIHVQVETIHRSHKYTAQEKLDCLLTIQRNIEHLAEWDTTVYLITSLRIGYHYMNLGKLEESLNTYMQALKLTDPMDSIAMHNVFYSIACVLYSGNDFEKSMNYAVEAESYLSNLKEDEELLKKKELYNLIGLIYFEQDVNDSAEYFFNKATEILDRDSTIDESEYLILYDNLAQLYEFTERPNQAIRNYEKSLEVYLKDSAYFDIAWNTRRLAVVYSEIGDSAKALEYLEIAKSAAEKMSYLDVKRDIYQTGLKLYAKYKITDSLSLTFKRYLDLNDSLVEAKISENIQEMETRYQVAKKEAALQMSVEKTARLNTELENQRLWASVLLIGLVGLIVLTGFIFYHLRQKRKVAELELNIKERQLDELMQSQESKAYAAMLRGQDQERERIAQDLHDRLGGTLAALKMSLRRKENKVSEEDMEIVDEAVQEVRNIAHNLSSGLMQKYGLNQALQQLKNTVEKSGGLKFQVFLHPKISVLGQGVAVELYRIVQELVNNTMKHAEATEVNLQTNFDGDIFNMIYEDNGKGFDPNKIKEGIGLENIKARVKRMNGILHIDAEKGRGAIFIIELNRGSK